MSNRDGQARRKQRYNDLGFTVGGPIYVPNHFNRDKNKLVFFFSQEYQRQLNPQGTRNQTVPTALERQGNFSQSVDKNGNPVTIRDPTTGTPFAGNIIPASRLYGPGLAVLNLYPCRISSSAPNGLPNKGFNYTSQISDSYPRREDRLRGDYNLSDKWKFFTRWVNNSDAVTSFYGSFVLGSSIPLVPITDSRPGDGVAVNATTLISPTMTNEASWGFGKNTIHITPTTDGLTRAKTGINLPVLYPDDVQQDFIPTFAFNGSRLAGTASFGTNNAPFYNYNTTIEWIDNLSKVWNQHTFKTGIYIQRSRKDQTSFANANGSYDFSDDSSNPLDRLRFRQCGAGSVSQLHPSIEIRHRPVPPHQCRDIRAGHVESHPPAHAGLRPAGLPGPTAIRCCPANLELFLGSLQFRRCNPAIPSNSGGRWQDGNRRRSRHRPDGAGHLRRQNRAELWQSAERYRRGR
jgi:hypothetical protein